MPRPSCSTSDSDAGTLYSASYDTSDGTSDSTSDCSSDSDAGTLYSASYGASDGTSDSTSDCSSDSASDSASYGTPFSTCDGSMQAILWRVGAAVLRGTI